MGSKVPSQGTDDPIRDGDKYAGTNYQLDDKTGEVKGCPVADLETLMFRAEHALMRAFISSAFTLWTRFMAS